MTGAVNLSSNRNSILTTMAINRPLGRVGGGQEGDEERIRRHYEGLVHANMKSQSLSIYPHVDGEVE